MKNVIDPHFQYEEKTRALHVSCSSLTWVAQTSHLLRLKVLVTEVIILGAAVSPELGRVLPIPESSPSAAQVSSEFFEKTLKSISFSQ